MGVGLEVRLLIIEIRDRLYEDWFIVGKWEAILRHLGPLGEEEGAGLFYMKDAEAEDGLW